MKCELKINDQIKVYFLKQTSLMDKNLLDTALNPVKSIQRLGPDSE